MKFEELEYTEQKEVIELFANWLKHYTHEVIKNVLARRDEIISNDFSMNLLRELKIRDERESKDFTSSLGFMMKDFDQFSKFDPHTHATTHASSYRDILYDMYIA